jgi:hypothetical protein
MANRLTPLILAASLFAGAAAQGALERIEEAWEADLLSVELPTHEAGRVTVRPCAACERATHPVGPRTRYVIAATADDVTLKAFREAAARVVSPRDALVYVLYDTATGEVTRLVLDVPDR